MSHGNIYPHPYWGGGVISYTPKGESLKPHRRCLEKLSGMPHVGTQHGHRQAVMRPTGHGWIAMPLMPYDKKMKMMRMNTEMLG